MLLKSHRMLYHLCALGKITWSMHSTRVQFKNPTAPRTGEVKYCLKRRETCWCCTACQRQMHCSTCPALLGESYWTQKMRNVLFKDKCWPFQSTAVHVACDIVLKTRTGFGIFWRVVGKGHLCMGEDMRQLSPVSTATFLGKKCQEKPVCLWVF